MADDTSDPSRAARPTSRAGTPANGSARTRVTKAAGAGGVARTRTNKADSGTTGTPGPDAGSTSVPPTGAAKAAGGAKKTAGAARKTTSAAKKAGGGAKKGSVAKKSTGNSARSASGSRATDGGASPNSPRATASRGRPSRATASISPEKPGAHLAGIAPDAATDLPEAVRSTAVDTTAAGAATDSIDAWAKALFGRLDGATERAERPETPEAGGDSIERWADAVFGPPYPPPALDGSSTVEGGSARPEHMGGAYTPDTAIGVAGTWAAMGGAMSGGPWPKPSRTVDTVQWAGSGVAGAKGPANNALPRHNQSPAPLELELKVLAARSGKRRPRRLSRVGLPILVACVVALAVAVAAAGSHPSRAASTTTLGPTSTVRAHATAIPKRVKTTRRHLGATTTTTTTRPPARKKHHGVAKPSKTTTTTTTRPVTTTTRPVTTTTRPKATTTTTTTTSTTTTTTTTTLPVTTTTCPPHGC